MKKIRNPYEGNVDTYKCFGCSPHNSIGLNLKFEEDGDLVVAQWKPRKQFEGYVNVLHGGIQATMLDEISSWVVYVKCKTAGVTSSLNVKYKRPVLLSNGDIVIKAKLKSQNHRIAVINAWIESADGTMMAEAEVSYFLFSEKDACEKYHYPGAEAFFEE